MIQENPKKLLIVVESLATDESSGAKANMAVIQNLASCGFKIKVLHYTRREVVIDGVATESIKERRYSPLFILSRIERYLRLYFKINLNSFIEKVFGFSFTFYNDSKSIVNALKKEHFDPVLVITLSQGASFRPHHAMLKVHKYHRKWLAYIHDPYPLHSYPRPYDWVEPGHNMKRKFFIQVSSKAEYAGFPSKLLAEWMQSYYPLLNNKSVIIPHQIPFSEKRGVELPLFFDPKKFNLLHAGNLLWGRDPSGLLKGFENFLNNNPLAGKDASLVFLGGKNYYSDLLKGYNERISQIYISKSAVPYEQVLQIQKLSAVNIILEAKAHISPFLPGKFPHCVRADRPILLLGPSLSESKRILGKNYPYWAEVDDVQKIESVITNLYLHWKSAPGKIKLDRPDIYGYLSASHLGALIENLLKK